MPTAQQNIPTRLNNPGDLKDPSTGMFREFSSPEEGTLALGHDLSAKLSGATSTRLGPDSTLRDLAFVYAPPSDNNDSEKYASDLANQLGTSTDTKLSDLQPRLRDLAQAVARNEGFQGDLPSLSSADFAAKIKAKYPAYQGLQDDDLVQRITAKYPQYGALVTQSQQPQSSPLGASATGGEGTDPSLVGGVVGALGRGAFSLFRGATQPVATLLARPFQAAAELAGASPEQVNAFSAKVPIYGQGGALDVPQNASDVLKDVGRAGETVALGLAPVAGGALFGLGSSVEQGNSPLSLNAAAQTAAGAVGGKVLDVAAPFIAKGAAAATPLIVKNAFGAVASKAAPLASAAGDFAANTKILPQAASDAINSAAGAVNAAPGGALDALRRQYGGTAGAAPEQIRSAALADVTKALGSTGQKSAGVFSGQSERLLRGLETLHDLAPGLKVSDELGDTIPYDPTTATLPQHVQALDSAKRQVYGALESNIAGATRNGVQVDLQPTIDHLTGILDSPGKVAQHARSTTLIGQLQKLQANGARPTDVNEFLQDLNVGLKGLFSSGQASIERQVDAGATRTLNDSLDRTVLDLEGGSKPIRDLKNQYSNLKSVEKGLVSKAQFLARRVGSGISDYINPFNVADALDLLSHNPIGAAKAGVRASLLFREKLKRDPERLLNDVFSGIAAYKGGGAPRPPRTVFGRPTAIPAIVGGAIKGAFGGQPLSTPGQ